MPLKSKFSKIWPLNKQKCTITLGRFSFGKTFSKKGEIFVNVKLFLGYKHFSQDIFNIFWLYFAKKIVLMLYMVINTKLKKGQLRFCSYEVKYQLNFYFRGIFWKLEPWGFQISTQNYKMLMGSALKMTSKFFRPFFTVF